MPWPNLKKGFTLEENVPLDILLELAKKNNLIAADGTYLNKFYNLSLFLSSNNIVVVVVFCFEIYFANDRIRRWWWLSICAISIHLSV